MERNIFGKEISTSGITQLNSRLFTLEESFIREELGSEQIKGLLSSMMLSTQDYILAANSFMNSKKSTLESMLFVQESLRKQQMTYASSMEGQNLVLSLLMTMLVGVLGWILFSTFRNRHYETMVSDNESSAKISEKNLIRTEVKKLMSSVDSAWIDSARESETLEEAKTIAKDFSNQMEHLESDINYANQQEITSVIDCRRRLEHLINSSITGSVYVTELGSIMDRLQSMEQELEGNQKYLIDDVNSLENAMESVQSTLSHLDEDMKKVMADTNRAHQSTEIIEESNKIIDE
jgi:peptidoglycan hydrolase CwlO-like protein